jgi:hypothetical protein
MRQRHARPPAEWTERAGCVRANEFVEFECHWRLLFEDGRETSRYCEEHKRRLVRLSSTSEGAGIRDRFETVLTRDDVSRAGAITIMVPDMVVPTAESRARCAAVVPDLNAVLDTLRRQGGLERRST